MFVSDELKTVSYPGINGEYALLMHRSGIREILDYYDGPLNFEDSEEVRPRALAFVDLVESGQKKAFSDFDECMEALQNLPYRTTKLGEYGYNPVDASWVKKASDRSCGMIMLYRKAIAAAGPDETFDARLREVFVHELFLAFQHVCAQNMRIFQNETVTEGLAECAAFLYRIETTNGVDLDKEYWACCRDKWWPSMDVFPGSAAKYILFADSVTDHGKTLNGSQNVIRTIFRNSIVEDEYVWQDTADYIEHLRDFWNDAHHLPQVSRGKAYEFDNKVYSFKGTNNYTKNRLVLDIVTKYIRDFRPESFRELRAAFPDELNENPNLGVVKRFDDVPSGNLVKYFMDENRKLPNGERIVVSNKWGTDINALIKQARRYGYVIKKIYQVLEEKG